MPATPRIPSPALTALAAVAAVTSLALTGCSGAGSPQGRDVEIRIAASAHPVDYEVHLAQAHGDYRAVHRMRTGQTRSFTVPAGWLTVRIPGLCVVPTAGRGSGTTVVEVDRGACRLV